MEKFGITKYFKYIVSNLRNIWRYTRSHNSNPINPQLKKILEHPNPSRSDVE